MAFQNLSSKVRKRIAGFLAGVTLLSSVNLPVFAEENDTEEKDETFGTIWYGNGKGTITISKGDEVVDTLESADDAQTKNFGGKTGETYTISVKPEEGSSVYVAEVASVNDESNPTSYVSDPTTDEVKFDVTMDIGKEVVVSFAPLDMNTLDLSVEAVNNAIDKLPSVDEVQQKMDAIGDNEEELNKYNSEMETVVTPVVNMYNALSQAQKDSVSAERQQHLGDLSSFAGDAAIAPLTQYEDMVDVGLTKLNPAGSTSASAGPNSGYLLGGNGPFYFDCSGFVSWCAAQVGWGMSGTTVAWANYLDAGGDGAVASHEDINLVAGESPSSATRKGDIIIIYNGSYDAGASVHMGIMEDQHYILNALYGGNQYPGGIRDDISVENWWSWNWGGAKSGTVARIYHMQSNKTIEVSVAKTSSNKPVTDNNPNYSLEGAVYNVSTSSDMSNIIGTITTDSNGNGSMGATVPAGTNTVYAQEKSASKGYCLDANVYTIDVSSGYGTFSSSEPFGHDPMSITINKKHQDYKTISKVASLEGTEFTVKYYAVDTDKYTSADSVKGLTPTRTWVIKAKAKDGKYVSYLGDEYKVSGDQFYKDGNSAYGFLPLGVVTIEESKAAPGYTLENAVINETNGTTVTETNGVAFFAVKGTPTAGYSVQGGNDYTIADDSIRGSLNISKSDADLDTKPQGDAPNLSAVFKITNTSAVEKTLHDKEGNVIAKAEPNADFYTLDGDLYKITTDDSGSWKSPDKFIEYGSYTVTEITPPTGYLLDSTPQSFEITADAKDGKVHFDFDYVNHIYHGGFKVQKHDSLTGTRAEGDNNLLMQFKVVNKSSHSVVVNGTEYKPNETVFTGATDEKGFYQSANNLLPYGTYELDESKEPNGYLKEGSLSVTFQVREDGKIYDLTDKCIVNNPARGKLSVHKITDIKYAGSSWSENEPDAVFGIVLKRYVDQYGSVEAALAHQYGISAGTVKDRTWLNKNIFQNGLVANTTNKDGAIADKMTGQEYAIIKTDKDGNGATADDALVMGQYIVKQLASPNDEVAVNKSETTVLFTENGQEKHIETSNTAEEYYIHLVKKDAKTGEIISLNSTDFKIYKLNDKGEKEYVTMHVGKNDYDVFRTSSESGKLTDKEGNKLPKGTFYADTEDEGTATTPLEVTAGTYYIEEVGAPSKYVIADPIKVEIKKANITEVDADGNQIITAVMNEQPISGELTIDKSIADYKADKDLLPADVLSKVQFTLTAAEDIIDPATGKVAVKKGDVAVNTSHQTIGQFYLDKDGKADIKDIMLGKYVLTETEIPSGLAMNTKTWDVKFAQKDGDSKTLVYKVNYDIENTPTKVEISKQAVTGQKELEGASLQVLDKNGTVVDSWKSTSEQHKIKGLNRGETYTLRETLTPEDNSYARATDVQFTVNEDGSVTHAKMINKLVDMSKVDMGGKEVEGAQMTVTDSEGKVIDKWTSGKEAHIIKNLVEGQDYILHEEVASEGYVKASDIHFTVSGADSNGDKENQHLTMVDKRVLISKEDVGGNEVPGANLTITDKETNEVVDKWTSTDEKHYASHLEVGKTYILSEDTTPLGYVKATNIEFTVTDDGVDQEVNMIDYIERVVKTDDKGNYVNGAKLETVDKETGEVLDSWISGQHLIDLDDKQVSELKKGKTVAFSKDDVDYKVTPVVNGKQVSYELVSINKDGVYAYADIDLDGNETAHRIQNLEEGHDYVVREVKTPDGFYTADDATITTGKDNHLTEMVDNTINYKIAKVDENGKYVEGVHLKLEDITNEKTVETTLEDGTVTKSTEGAVEVELPNDGVTTNKPFELSNVLIGGHTYRLTETETVDGYSMPKTATLTFTVSDKGTSDFITITMINVSNKIVVMKVDENGTPIKGAQMQILKGKEVEKTVTEKTYDSETGKEEATDKVVKEIVPETDEDGNPIVLHEWTTTGEPEDIGAYVKGGTDDKYILREVKSPWGYDAIEDTPFTVNLVEDSTGTAQIVYATDVHSTINVKVIKVDAENKETRLQGAEFTLYNKDNKVVVDKNGKDCVSTTDKNGELKFAVSWQPGMYVKETKAPENFKLNSNKFEIAPEENVFDFTDDFTITVTDEQLPKTGVKGIAGAVGIGAVACIGAAVLLTKKKKEEK